MTVALIALDDSLQHELSGELNRHCPSLRVQPFHSVQELLLGRGGNSVDLVFCPSDSKHLGRVLKELEAGGVRPPVVAVTRHPETGEWLDALEAGASDYFAVPTEPIHLRWILNTNLLQRRNAAA